MTNIEKMRLPLYIVMLNFTIANKMEGLHQWNDTSVEHILCIKLPYESKFIRDAYTYCHSRRCMMPNGDRCKFLNWYSDECKRRNSLVPVSCVIMGFYDHIFKRRQVNV